MKKHLFLTGSDSVANSVLLRTALDWRLATAGGFVTQCICGANGTVTARELCPAAAAAGVEGYTPLRFLDYRTEPPSKDNEVFRNFGVQLLQEAAYYPFSVLDGFGGFELVIPQFRAALAEFLSSDQPIIGVLIPREETEELRRSLGIGEKLSLLSARLYESLMANSDTLVLKTSGAGDETAKRIIRQWISEYAG